MPPQRLEDDDIQSTMIRAPFSLGSQPQKAAPRLVGPDAAEDRADETEKRGEADDAINHLGQGLADFHLAATFGDGFCPGGGRLRAHLLFKEWP